MLTFMSAMNHTQSHTIYGFIKLLDPLMVYNFANEYIIILPVKRIQLRVLSYINDIFWVHEILMITYYF